MFRSYLITGLTLLSLSLTPAQDPLLSSWRVNESGKYASLFPTLADETAGNAVTTWSRGEGVQTSPTYAGVHEVSYSQDWVYIRTTGLGTHIMGPWYLNQAKTNLFPNYPANRSVTYRLPRNPTTGSGASLTGLGAIGYFVDGVAMFDSRDAFSYSNANAADAAPGTAFAGDGVWNRDAYVNESVTFDAANAHQAGSNYHYHANPPALRHLLGDHVDYDAMTHVYSESTSPVTKHSPILGWMSDGFPLYGPYGYSDPNDALSGVRIMISGYQLRDGTNGTTNLASTGRTTLPPWAAAAQGISATLPSNRYGPAVSTPYPLGQYLEDNDYKGDLGMTQGVDFDLDLHNGRFCVTPEFPGGTYAYFVAILPDGTPVFPYNIGRTYSGTPSGGPVANIVEAVTVFAEGGPEKSDTAGATAVDTTSGDVTLTWNGVQGGEYEIDYSSNLRLWRSMAGSVTANSDQPSAVDAGIAQTESEQFYRVRRVGMAAFDSAGFNYTPGPFAQLATVVVTLAGTQSAPSDLGELPLSVSFNGGTAVFVSRPAANQIELRVPLDGLADGNYPVVVEFAGAAGTHTGTVTVGGGSPITNGNNVLLILVDDWGIDWSPIDNTTPGLTLPNMPTLQGLASTGLQFTQAYAQPVCSPTRATILTGRQPFRHGVGNPTTNSTLPASELTLPEIFTAQSSPYGLASFGKWHLGSGQTGPFTTGGWPTFKGILQGGVTDYFDWTKTEVINGVATQTANVTTYTTTDQVNDAVSWIGAQGSAPWFCWLALNAPHTPFHEPPAGLAPTGGYSNPGDSSNEALFRRMLEAMDTEIGRLLASVDLSKTNIIIVGDNGSPAQVAQPPYGSGHAKDDLYQGGIHVPLVVSGPDVTVAPGSTSSSLVHVVDLFSTILQLSGIDPAAATATVDAIDSKTLVPILQGSDSMERCLIAEKFGDGAGDGRALISDANPSYKLIIFGDPLSTADTPTYEFYHLPTDLNEQSPLNLTALNATEQAAFDLLVAKDAALGGGYSDPPAGSVQTVYIELQDEGAMLVPPLIAAQGPSAGSALHPTAVTIGGQAAAFDTGTLPNGNPASRVDATDSSNRFWVKATIDPTAAGLTSGTYSMQVTFPGATPRVFTAVNSFVVP
ncbi:MAG: sulfatase-like hydrolase/transferase [Verrucomicrobiales bacterium]|nr:sulfatase-like hydrolase/transferase [Verrucomicrobiales bacterium]